jgi:hypothetical protein
MSVEESPGAVAAHGALEADRLGRQVVSKNKLLQNPSQAPIPATLIGSDRCTAEGISVRAYAPVLALCRALIEAGHDPGRALHAHRGGVLALVVRSIGEGAGLTVEDDRHGTPRLRRWRGRRGYGAGSPALPTGGAAAAAAPRHAIASGGRR